ncbi:MAG: galactosyldiacylglycerol synthase [Verrucomicrobia bacterium]|nr:galactosyldiacylglycerol synthase [Verrucomicrobiota bacterium]
MPNLYNKDTNEFVGIITEDQLDFLKAQLEEESAEDTDYYLNRDTLELFERQGADAGLMELLRRAMGDKEEVEVRWVS